MPFNCFKPNVFECIKNSNGFQYVLNTYVIGIEQCAEWPCQNINYNFIPFIVCVLVVTASLMLLSILFFKLILETMVRFVHHLESLHRQISKQIYRLLTIEKRSTLQLLNKLAFFLPKNDHWSCYFSLFNRFEVVIGKS